MLRFSVFPVFCRLIWLCTFATAGVMLVLFLVGEGDCCQPSTDVPFLVPFFPPPFFWQLPLKFGIEDSLT